MESISTIGIISSSCTISQDEFDIMELDIKSEVFDEFAWEKELFVDIAPEDDEEPVICSLCIHLYHEAAQGRRYSVRIRELEMWCPHHIIDGAPAAEKKVSMKNENIKKRKRTEAKRCTRNKRWRGQQPSSSSMNDGQPPTSTVENIIEPEGEEPLSIMDGVDGQLEQQVKQYLAESANCTTLTKYLSSVSVTNLE